MPQQTKIELKFINLNYNDKTKVFDDNSLLLLQDLKQTNKLFGIIGPSGTGKTTLLSILGGQLNPDSGQVFINDTDIYQVDDNTRRNLIALQMQTATSLRGSLRYNLLFGMMLDEEVEKDFDDAYLIEVLKRVGLWQLFEAKDGLDTLIGEGGLNLSGGQRQRLNFAGLFLRVKRYKPALVLIDEPTSSLDEISEKSITDTINEIASQAVTMVVAHRLVTVAQAAALLDTSLLEAGQKMEFYKQDELSKVSQYYRDLLEGRAKLDD